VVILPASLCLLLLLFHGMGAAGAMLAVAAAMLAVHGMGVSAILYLVVVSC
jgi:hypothetical protein